MLNLGIAALGLPVTSIDGTQVAIKFANGQIGLALKTWFADGGYWTLQEWGVARPR